MVSDVKIQLLCAGQEGSRLPIHDHSSQLLSSLLMTIATRSNAGPPRRQEEETVALVMAGHFHRGGYAADRATGTHHVTLDPRRNVGTTRRPGALDLMIWLL